MNTHGDRLRIHVVVVAAPVPLLVRMLGLVDGSNASLLPRFLTVEFALAIVHSRVSLDANVVDGLAVLSTVHARLALVVGKDNAVGSKPLKTLFPQVRINDTRFFDSLEEFVPSCAFVQILLDAVVNAVDADNFSVLVHCARTVNTRDSVVVSVLAHVQERNVTSADAAVLVVVLRDERLPLVWDCDVRATVDAVVLAERRHRYVVRGEGVRSTTKSSLSRRDTSRRAFCWPFLSA